MTGLLAVIVVVVAVAGLSVAAALVALQAVVVAGVSMQPTFPPGQVVWATRGWPRRWLREGNVILIKGQGVLSADGSMRLIKRIARLGPDKITISGDNVTPTEGPVMLPTSYESVAGIVLERGLLPRFRRGR